LRLEACFEWEGRRDGGGRVNLWTLIKSSMGCSDEGGGGDRLRKAREDGGMEMVAFIGLGLGFKVEGLE
jgi:hypothetical protein